MKKLKLDLAKTSNVELLTRDQLKAIFGGNAQGSSQFEPQDCYCTGSSSISFGCVTDEGCDKLTRDLCGGDPSICISR